MNSVDLRLLLLSKEKALLTVYEHLLLLFKLSEFKISDKNLTFNINKCSYFVLYSLWCGNIRKYGFDDDEEKLHFHPYIRGI